MADKSRLALIAAHSASAALAELLRFAREGNTSLGHPFDDVNAVAQLAEAAAIMAEIEQEDLREREEGWADDIEMLGQLVAACRKFLVDWSE